MKKRKILGFVIAPLVSLGFIGCLVWFVGWLIVLESLGITIVIVGLVYLIDWCFTS